MSLLRPALLNALLAVCAASPFAFVLTLPFVDLGQWRQVETATVAVHGAAGLAALLMALLALSGERAVRDAAFSAPV
ncbi:hypothetical protein ACFPYM_20395, partial [Methylobacterium hispanicum]